MMAPLLLSLLAVARVEPGAEQSSPEFEALPGRAIGLLLMDSANVADREGRSGPEGAVAFLRGDGAFRWVYLPAADHKDADLLDFGVGEKGDGHTKQYAVQLATRERLKHLGIADDVSLVEVEVNDGAGSPPEESFVATSIRQVDGTKEYPIKLTDALSELQKTAREYYASQQEKLDAALQQAAKEVAPDGFTPTEKNRSTDELSLTWDAEQETLRVRMLRRLTNGIYVDSEAIEGPIQNSSKAGQEFGAVTGMQFIVGRDGSVESKEALAVKPFTRTIEPRK